MPTYRYRLTPAEVDKVKRLLVEGVSVGAIATRFSVSPRTICYYKVGCALPPRPVVEQPVRRPKGRLAGTPLLASILTPTPTVYEDDQLSA